MVGVTSCVLMVVGLRRNRPVNLSAWLLIASGLFLWVAGDVVFILEGLFRKTPAYPTYADHVYLCAMPILALGLFRLSRDRWPKLSARFTDWAIIAVSLAIVYWVFVIGVVATNTALPLSTRLVTAGYPTAGVVLFAVVLPMVLRPGWRTVSRWLLIVGCVFTLVCNILYTLVPAAAAYPRWVGMAISSRTAAAELHRLGYRLAAGLPLRQARGFADTEGRGSGELRLKAAEAASQG
jgi:hypothetical protein